MNDGGTRWLQAQGRTGRCGSNDPNDGIGEWLGKRCYAEAFSHSRNDERRQNIQLCSLQETDHECPLNDFIQAWCPPRVLRPTESVCASHNTQRRTPRDVLASDGPLTFRGIPTDPNKQMTL